RTVPGDLAAAVDVDDRRAVQRALVRLGALAGGVDRGVLEQQHGVGQLAGHDLRVDRPLVVPGLLVVDVVGGEAEVLETHGATVRAALWTTPAGAWPRLARWV